MGGMLLLLFHIVLDHVSASNICCWRFAQRLPTSCGQTLRPWNVNILPIQHQLQHKKNGNGGVCVAILALESGSVHHALAMEPFGLFDGRRLSQPHQHSSHCKETLLTES